MNKSFVETKDFVKALKKELSDLHIPKNLRIMVAPTAVNLRVGVKRAKKSAIEVVAQNMHQETNGAYTGEVSASMLEAVGVKTVLIGHSERREYFKEDSTILSQKVTKALAQGLEIIFCFGEKLEDREAEKHFDVVKEQISSVLFALEPAAWKQIILAYEPVWAIGTGKTASADQAQEMHAYIRSIVAENYTTKVANKVSILYGGSVKPANANELFSKEDVDGGLVGGASLEVDSFMGIFKAFL